jgi:hypothetical protein
VLAGCGGTNRLQEYTFDDATVAVIANIPPRPLVFTDGLFDARVHPNDPIGSIFRAGTAIAKHNEAREAQERMDSALAHVDVADRVARRALSGSAQTLGYRPVDRPTNADYILDIRIADYGLVADSWDAAVRFEVEAEMLVVDGRSRKPIWKKRIREAEPVSQAALGLGTTFGNVYTARALSKLTAKEMAAALEHLADYTADHLTDALRHDFYTSR